VFHYGLHLTSFLNPLGMPCWKPPYGTLSSYDLKTGKLLWNEPFGEVQKWGFYMPKSWGSVTIGAPVVTRSGLIFIGNSILLPKVSDEIAAFALPNGG
jgi:quinoprotein glucose dehydrogenase